jgi:DNA segregation ATPase FtsK/SpoIIIE, S-DNA-T family
MGGSARSASKLREMNKSGKRPSSGRGAGRSAPGRRSLRARGRRRSRRSRGPLGRLLAFPQRVREAALHSSGAARELTGLGLIALGVFMAFVLWGGWNGGGAGHGLGVAFGWLLGRARALAPLALCLAGFAIVASGSLPDVRPQRAGALSLLAALSLALAADSFGLSSARGAGTSHWSSSFLQAHGGAAGEALYVVAHALVQNVGVDILVLFLLVCGVIMLTGASLADALARGARALAALARRLWGVQEGRGTQRRAKARVKQPALDMASAAEAFAEPHEPAFSAEGDGEEVLRSMYPPEPDESDGSPQIRAAAGTDGGGDKTAQDTSDEEEEISGVTYVSPDDLTPRGRLRESVTSDPGFSWKRPPPKLLERSSSDNLRPDTAGQAQTAAVLVEALGHFGVQAKVIGSVTGPHITRYELKLAPGTKVAKVTQLKDDLAYALAATDIRILAPIPGKQAVGVEVPNAKRRIVRLGDVFGEPPAESSPLSVWLGKDVAGKVVGADLAKMPHLLVAGTTGAGKSAAINSMLSSVLLRATPHEVRLVLVDPKQVELNHYESIPHLLTPVITSPRMAANALQNLVREMEQRYGTMSLARTRSLVELNAARSKRGEAPLPYILCVIDELADLMMVAPADVEDSIIRLAQKARAVGIHLVLATQSPRVDVITGMIKANVPSRIAFAVSSQMDSRVILDQNGAESLLGQGDMLFSPVGSSRLQRIQGAFVDEEEIARLTEHWRRQGEPELHEELLEQVESEDGADDSDELDPDEDPILRDAITLVAEMQTASTSMLQRRLRLGYTRAGRVIDMLERRGVISGYEGSKPRQVLITEADLPRVLANLGEPAATATD